MGKHRVKTDYEEVRKAQILENQARLASVGLSKTIAELRNITGKLQTEKKKHNKIDYFSTPLRRSKRLKGGNESKVENEKSRAAETDKPKRPTTAFFMFKEEFREQYKEKYPNKKSVAAVGKAAGEKWKSFSDAEKAPYQAKIDEMMAEYQNKMQSYNINKKQQAVDVSALPRALRLIAD